MAQSYSNILSETDINYILSLPEVVTTKEKLETQNVIKFSVALPDAIKQSLQEKLGINLQGITTIPLRWIKGDTAPHIDLGDKFLKTYLLYLNDSQGELVLGEEHYQIAKNTAFVFNEGLNHYTLNTGSEPRLMIGPMSENAIAIGGPPCINYYSNQSDAENTINDIAVNYSNCTVGDVSSGDIGSISVWIIASNSTGTSTGTVNNGTILDGPLGSVTYYLYPAPTSTTPQYPPPPYNPQVCVNPPYNANNFTPANAPIYSTLVSYANNSPNFPWATGSNAQQIYRSKQNVSYFNSINQQTQAIRTANGPLGYLGTLGSQPYPQFKTDAERLMYIQGMNLTAARNRVTGQNPSGPAGVPCSTIYGIINS
jgi:hypothetical protein